MVPEYVDYAEYYDQDHATAADIPFYLDHARECGSPILELACGTGRVLIPLAEAGHELHGVDSSENMLAVCRRKVQEMGLSDQVHLTNADMAAFELAQRGFALCYVPVRSFMHLFTQEEQLACLRRAYEHLHPGGRFIVDLYAPDFRLLSQQPNGPFAFRKAFDLPNGHHIIRQDRFVRNDLAEQVTFCEMRFEEYEEGALVRQRTVPTYTRYTFRYELQLLLEHAGFEVQDWHRDYERNPYDGTGEIIAVATRPSG